MKIPSDLGYYRLLDPLEEAKFIHRLWHETLFCTQNSEEYLDDDYNPVSYNVYQLEEVPGVWIVFVLVDTRCASVGEAREFRGLKMDSYFGELTYAVVARYVVTASTFRSAFNVARNRFKPEVRRWSDDKSTAQISINFDRDEMITLAEHCRKTISAINAEQNPSNAKVVTSLQRIAEVLVASGGYPR